MRVDIKRYSAEMIGTFVLVVGGVGSAVIAGPKIGYMGISFAFGLALLAMVYTIGPISGCHINPAVTLGAFLTGKSNLREAVAYMASQIIGAIVGAAVVLLIADGASGGYVAASAGLGANGYGAHSPGGYSLTAALVAETVLTMFLVLTVLGSTNIKAPAGFAGIPIGFVLTLIHLVGIPITNTSVNPARSIGPAVFVGGWALQQLWAFVVAPFAGAVLAACIYLVIASPADVLTTRQAEQELESAQRERKDIPRVA